MKISDRIRQLAEIGIRYKVKPLLDSDRQFSGDIVARFEEGEGVEYIPVRKGRRRPDVDYPEKEEAMYRVLVAEIGSSRALESTRHGLMAPGQRVGFEIHLILDLETKMAYEFKLPSRSYLNTLKT